MTPVTVHFSNQTWVFIPSKKAMSLNAYGDAIKSEHVSRVFIDKSLDGLIQKTHLWQVLNNHLLPGVKIEWV